MDTAEEGPIDMVSCVVPSVSCFRRPNTLPPPFLQDADFIAFPDERKEKKKKRKEKKRKNKENRTDAEADDVDLEAEQSLSVEAKKEKVKKALEEYKSLDHHGDMVSQFWVGILRRLSDLRRHRSVICRLASNTLKPLPSLTVSHRLKSCSPPNRN